MPNTVKQDGRKLSHEVLEFIRINAVTQVVKNGKSPEDVIKGYGMNRAVIYGRIKKYKAGGRDALKSRKSSGRPPILTKEQRKKVEKAIIKGPKAQMLDFGLRTVKRILEYIVKEFGVAPHETTVYKRCKKRGISWQKPLYKAYEQNPEKVEERLNEEYPAIKKEAKKEKRLILWIDEAGFKLDNVRGKTRGKKGQRPIVKGTGKRASCNCISAIGSGGELRFKVYTSTMNGEKFRDFLSKLVEDFGQNVTAIVDGHPSHKTKLVKERIESTEGRMKMYFLPGYSPELNPDEQVRNAAKQEIKGAFVHNKDELVDTVRSIMHSLQKKKERLISMFSVPSVAYVLQ